MSLSIRHKACGSTKHLGTVLEPTIVFGFTLGFSGDMPQLAVNGGYLVSKSTLWVPDLLDNDQKHGRSGLRRRDS